MREGKRGMMDWNKECNYCDEDLTHAEWFNQTCHRVAWKMFDSQDEWIHRCGEKGKKPIIKSAEEFMEAFDEAWRESAWLPKSECFYALLKLYHDDDIVLGEELEFRMKDWFGELDD